MAIIIAIQLACTSNDTNTLPFNSNQIKTPTSQPITPSNISKITNVNYSTLLHTKSKTTRWYRLLENPRITIIDFASLHEQAQTLNRVASLIEKAGMPDNRVIKQEELDHYFKTNSLNPDTFYFGHNYNIEDLIKFLNMVQRDHLKLNFHEQNLHQRLQELGLLKAYAGKYKIFNPPQAIVTLTQLQADNPISFENDSVDIAIRCTVLRHELSHGEFSTNPSYRQHTKSFWQNTLTASEKTLFKKFLSNKGYAIKNDDLIANEMQAYLIHSPNLRAFDPNSINLTKVRLKELRNKFISQTNSSWIIQHFYFQKKIPTNHWNDLNCNFD